MWDWDATDTEGFSVEMESGQWYSQKNAGVEIGDNTGAQDDHQADQSAEDSGGQHSVAGGGMESADTEGNLESVQNPTTGMQTESPQQSVQSSG